MHARTSVQQEPPASLANRLRERIRREGAISFCDWMQAALYDPAEGYYCRSDLERWGSLGDYRTSPERSPLFAATFARYFAQLDAKLGAPASLTVVEAGAGAGHFAAGVLETLQRDYPQIFARTLYLIDEASADTRERAAHRLAPFKERIAFRRIGEIEAPFDAAIVFANELLDAFPVHRVTMRDKGLLELCIGCDADGNFVWLEREPTTPLLADYFSTLQLELAQGQIAEVNLAALDWISMAATSFRRGFLITVDYGAEAAELYGSPARGAGTLRAFHQHRFADDPLARPGQQDLTTTVDWTSIKRASADAGLRTVVLERQDKFLIEAGLLEQLERMTAAARSEAERAALRASARHMILPDGMSASFQVLVQETANSGAGSV